MSVKVKIIGTGVLAASLPVMVILTSLLVQRRGLNVTLGQNLNEQVESQLSGIAQDMYALCKTQQESIEMAVEADLNVAHDLLRRGGGIRFLPETVSWEARNQFTLSSTMVTLPKMAVGNVWLGQTSDRAAFTGLVDELNRGDLRRRPSGERGLPAQHLLERESRKDGVRLRPGRIG